MNVTFTANTANELKVKMIDFFNTFNVPVSDSAQIVMDLNAPEKSAVSEKAPLAEKKKRGPKPKNKDAQKAAPALAEDMEEDEMTEIAVAVEPVDELQDEVESLTATAPITKEMLAEIVKKVAVEKNIETAREVFLRFGAGKLSDLDPKHFSQVYQACEELLAE